MKLNFKRSKGAFFELITSRTHGNERNEPDPGFCTFICPRFLRDHTQSVLLEIFLAFLRPRTFKKLVHSSFLKLLTSPTFFNNLQAISPTLATFPAYILSNAILNSDHPTFECSSLFLSMHLPTCVPFLQFLNIPQPLIHLFPLQNSTALPPHPSSC